MKTPTFCHQCKFNNTGNEACISCALSSWDEQKFNYHQYVNESDHFNSNGYVDSGFNFDEKYEEEEKVKEQKFINFIFDLFHDSTPLELLTFQGLIKNKSLQEIGNELTHFFKTNCKEQTRFHIFQLRKKIFERMPQLQSVFIMKNKIKKTPLHQKRRPLTQDAMKRSEANIPSTIKQKGV